MSDAGMESPRDTKSPSDAYVTQNSPRLDISAVPRDSPPSPSINSRPHLQRKDSLDADDYFSGPRNIQKHSKWPLILQLHGSIIPKLILPLFLVACWSTAITVISKRVHDLSVHSVLLTILGFVVGLSLSFRSSTAYERYAEGRRYWGTLTSASQTLGRIVWVHASETAGGKDSRELLVKKIGALNLIVGFAIALKHTLRFEPCAGQADIQPYIAHLDTFVKRTAGTSVKQTQSLHKSVGEYLGVSFAQSNPRKLLKKANQHQGNLPLEILSHIGLALDSLVANKQLTLSIHQTIAYNHINILNDCMTGCDRVLNTPLPIAYTIAISQITFVYVILLPFQLTGPLGWVAIPATIAAAYIIFGLLFIGHEIENPFGHDVNDLPLEVYCDQIATDLDIIASLDRGNSDDFLLAGVLLHPVSAASGDVWSTQSEDKLREAIRNKPQVIFDSQRRRNVGKSRRDQEEKDGEIV